MIDDQDDLFGGPHTRAGDPDTSHLAPSEIDIAKLQRIVRQHHLAAGARGLTGLELERLCGDHSSTWRSRRSELVEKRLIVNSGHKREQSANGKNPRQRIVWIAIEYWRQADGN